VNTVPQHAAVVLRGRESIARAVSWRGVAGILLVASCVRLVAALVVNHPELRRGEFAFRDDETEYHDIAAALVTSGRFSLTPDGPPTARRSPGMSLGLAAVYHALGPSPLVALAFVLLCSLVLLAAVGALARATTNDPAVAMVAMAIVALLPTAVFTGGGIWSEPAALASTVLAVYLLVRAEQQREAWRWALVGAAAAAAFLTRTSVVFLLPFLLLRAALTRDVRCVAAFGLTLALPLCAWGVRNQIVLGRFMVGYSLAGQGMWENNNPVSAGVALPTAASVGGGDLQEAARRGVLRGSWVPAAYLPGSEEAMRDDLSELEADRRFGELAAAFVRQQPLAYIRLLGFKVRRLLTAEPIAAPFIDDTPTVRRVKRALTLVERWFVLVFGGLGLAALYRSRNRWRHHHAVFALAGVPVVLLGLVNARFFLPIAIGLAVPAAVGLLSLRRAATPGATQS